MSSNSNDQEDNKLNLETEIQGFSNQSAIVTAEDRRLIFKNYVAGILAIAILLSLLGVIAWHIISISLIMSKYQNTTSKNLADEEAKLNKTSILVNDTAKTVYSFLGTLTAAVSGFYFTSLSSSSSNNNKE